MIKLDDIFKAREVIADVAVRTPIFASQTISAQKGNKLFLKCEHLQKTGSFKIRGAANKVKQEAERGAKHFVAASSGNHGQAVAYIANYLGLRSTIVVPEDAALCKQDAIRAYQGEIEFCGTTSPERLLRAQQISEEQGAVFIPPYDDPAIISGQGTIGLEILEQLDDIDVVYVPVGGGGLISGVAAAIKESNPRIRVVGVEPAIANDTYLSLLQGSHVNIGATRTIADGLRTSTPGEMTFPLIRRYVDEVVLVSEEEIKAAFSLVLSRMKQLIEPSGAVSVAAALANKDQGKRIVAVVSGGNIDTAVIPTLLG
jgi:threonine dehydratase